MVNTGISSARIDSSYFEFAEAKTYTHYVALNVAVLTMDSANCFIQTLFTTGRETSLKQVFSRNPEYWHAAFPGRPIQDTHSLAVYRKSLESIEGYSGRQLHILLLKYEGCKSPRNPNALSLEQFCGTQFFGTLVVALSLINSPYSLCSFGMSDMQILTNINRLRGNSKPAAMVAAPLTAPTSATVFPSPPASQPAVRPVLERCFYEMSAGTFFMYRYKTLYCPQIAVKHDWNACLYAHWVYDYRRPPDKFYYIAEMCPLVAPDRGGVCKNGNVCAYSHSPLEKLYHPSKYKVFPCDSLRKGTACVRKGFCAFYHSPSEQRNPVTLKVADPPGENFLSYAEPKVESIQIITNYIDAVSQYGKENPELGGKLRKKQMRLARHPRFEDDAGAETRSEKRAAAAKETEEMGPSSMEGPKDYFALFSNDDACHCRAIPSTGVTSFTSEEAAGKIFIDGQYIDSAEALDVVDDVENESKDSKMTLICESICSSGSCKTLRRSSPAK